MARTTVNCHTCAYGKWDFENAPCLKCSAFDLWIPREIKDTPKECTVTKQDTRRSRTS
jgi:hypothetical protein